MNKRELLQLSEKLGSRYGFKSSKLIHYFYELGRPGLHVIEWPTGSGKSLLTTILAIMFAYLVNMKIFIFTRTYSQMNEYLRRFKEISDYLEIKIPFSMVLGKDFSCPYGDLHDPESSYVLCKYLGYGKRCPDYQKLFSDAFLSLEFPSDVTSLNDVVEHFINDGFCPYYSLKYISMNSKIVLSTYYHLFNGLASRPHPFKYVIFIDESHNLINQIVDTNIIWLEKNLLDNVIKYLDERYPSKNLFGKWTWIIKGMKTNVSHVKQFFSELKSLLLKEYIEWLLGKRSDEHQIISRSIENVRIFLHIDVTKLISVKLDNDKIYLILAPNLTLFRTYLESAFSSILLSATMSPKEFFEKIFNLLGIKKPFITHQSDYLYDPFSSSKMNLYFVRKFTSRYKKRSFSMYLDIANLTLDIFAKSRVPTLLFVPSLEIAESLMRILNEIINERSLTCNVVLLDRNIELHQSEDLENSIIILTQRGRYSEGINIFRNLGRHFNLILFGLSLQPRDIHRDAILKRLLKLKGKDLFLYGYALPAMIFFIQSIGRVLNKGSQVNIYILEDRVRKYLEGDLVPLWFKDLLRNENIVSIESI